jgi:hypothetical protein
MKAKIKVQSIQVHILKMRHQKRKIHIVFWSKKKDTLLLSELNGIVYNFNANFDDY